MILPALILAPAALSATTGEEIALAVVAAAGTSTIGTVEARIAFDPARLTAERFALAPGWVALPERGYASIDNGAGLAVETAGYPRGFSGTTTLGTLYLRAAAPGAAKALLAGGSAMLDAAGKDEFASGGASVITINAPPSPSRPRAAPARPSAPPVPAPPRSRPRPALPAAAAEAPHAWLSAVFAFFARLLPW
jgi:hypothetical protein